MFTCSDIHAKQAKNGGNKNGEIGENRPGPTDPECKRRGPPDPGWKRASPTVQDWNGPGPTDPDWNTPGPI